MAREAIGGFSKASATGFYRPLICETNPFNVPFNVLLTGSFGHVAACEFRNYPLKNPTGQSGFLFFSAVLKAECRNTSTCNLGVFVRLHTADTHCPQALAVFHDGNATFQHALDVRC